MISSGCSSANVLLARNEHIDENARRPIHREKLRVCGGVNVLGIEGGLNTGGGEGGGLYPWATKLDWQMASNKAAITTVVRSRELNVLRSFRKHMKFSSKSWVWIVVSLIVEGDSPHPCQHLCNA